MEQAPKSIVVKLGRRPRADAGKVDCPNLAQRVQATVIAMLPRVLGEKQLSGITSTERMVNFPRQQEDFVALSDREREVLQCIAHGLSSKQCAQELGIAPRTVERHVENLRNKLNARNKPHLVAKALAAGHI